MLVGKPEGKDHSEDLGLSKRIYWSESSRNSVWWCGMDSSGSG